MLRPYGVFGVISPFNFPSALAAGPIGAALVAGNTVVFKPAETTPWSGVLLAEILHEAGLPDGVLNLVTGGPAVGKALVAARGVDGIVFTGSYEVGREITRRSPSAATRGPCITEMGGKNPTIVTPPPTSTRRRTASAVGVRRQRPEVLGLLRVLVEETVHDALIERLAEGAQVVDGGRLRRRRLPGRAGQQRRLVREVQPGVGEAHRDGRRRGRRRGAHRRRVRERLVRGADDRGRPAGRAPADARRAVRAVRRGRAGGRPGRGDRAANAQSLGLTAGLFSEDAGEKQQFLDRIEAGVVYVNRAAGSTTGAWPGYQTFGGWKGSGSTGKSAFGPHYVQLFMREQSRTILP